MTSTPPRTLTIAGSDSGGGAGIQADLKTFQALGCYGMSAITAITAQNTVAVTAVHELPPEMLAAQLDAVLADIGADAAKTGMVASPALIEAVADAVARHAVTKLVVDPVMVAKSGDKLLADAAQETLVQRLLPLALVLTPNIPEAEVITGMAIASEADMKEAGVRIHALGPRFVLMKGGHMQSDTATDWLYDGEAWQRFSTPRIETRNTHGTGCTYSAAICAYLARGLHAPEAVGAAKQYLHGAIEHSLDFGAGHGPLDHAWRINDERSTT